MLSPTDVIRPNEQQVAAKVMDGEAILINLSTGAYYSIPSTGGFVWSLVERGMSIHAITDAVASHYVVPREQAAADVLRLADELVAEGLAAVAARDAMSSAAPTPSSSPLAYQAPSIEKFTDMAEMFALDPPLPGLANPPNKS